MVKLPKKRVAGNLILSRHNIFSRMADSSNYFIVNLLTRSADILSPEKAREILDGSFTNIEEYREKGYLIDPEEEKRRYRTAYLDFLAAREAAEVQVFFVPTYACNFACTYCYQDEYSPQKEVGSIHEVIQAFYAYLDRSFSGRKKYITIFGGEPLLPGRAARERLALLLRGAAERDLGVALVTNGYHLLQYLDLISGARIREIQVTLDGPEAVHDRRRPLKDSAKEGRGTFGRIVRGIDGALELGLPVNLRVVLDRENIDHLPGLVRLAKQRGWIGHPSFKTQLGRNYELHTCQANSQRLLTRVGLYEALYGLIKAHPEILEFHRPAYSVAGFLFENGELPDPLFDSCPGCTTEWAFDYSGRIYACTATVGREEEALGRFFPVVTLDDEQVEEWEERDVTTIPECASCSLRLGCGGGCAAVAKNRGTGLQSPDCRPVKELLEMGISLYFDKEE